MLSSAGLLLQNNQADRKLLSLPFFFTGMARQYMSGDLTENSTRELRCVHVLLLFFKCLPLTADR